MEKGVHPGNGGQSVAWESAGIRLLREKNGKLEVIRDFGKETVKEVVRAKPPTNAIQHLYVNPVDGKVFVAEADSAPTTKASTQWLEMHPETDKIKIIDLPFNPIDCAFDLNGFAYLRNTDRIMRFDPKSWKEIPFDYGEEGLVGRDGGMGGREAAAISAINLPAKSPVCYHQGGISVSPKGHIIASCAYRFEGISAGGLIEGNQQYNLKNIGNQGKGYEPKAYPGRIAGSTSPCIHVWDKHGKMLIEDAVPGVGQVDGVAMDANDNIYFMHTRNRMIDGKPYFNSMSETLMKVKPKMCKIVSSSSSIPVPLPKGEYPNMAQQLNGMWATTAEWFYPGVGYAGFNASQAGGGCACWFPRFALDLYGRSFAPEPQQFAVAVVDTAGNLILRIGKYGNVDNAGAKSKIPMGGDEVSLFHPLYVGVHTDHQIYISDVGNGRLLNVKLNYHVDEKVALKDIADDLNMKISREKNN
jgi:hypothetical protein